MTVPKALDAIEGVAVDVGGTKIAAARYVRGAQTQRVQVPTRAEEEIAGLLMQIDDVLGALDYRPGERLGFAMTGRVAENGVWSAVNAGTLPRIQGENLGRMLERRFGRPVRLCNDAQAAALAEHRFGAGIGSRAFAYLTVSTGVGGGIVLDGRPLTSPDGWAGHIGFLSSTLSETTCGSGRDRTVESVAGGRAIAAAAAEAGHQGMTAREVFAARARKEPWAAAIVDRSAKAIARLCCDLRLVVGADRVALGGSIGCADGYQDAVLAHLGREPASFRMEVVPAALRDDSALVGALV